MRSALSLASVCVLALGARAQGINVDFGPPGSSAGTAPATYGGPAQSPGVWNAVTTFTTNGLLDTTGATTSVNLVVNCDQAYTVFETNSFAGPPDDALLNDNLRADMGFLDLTFSGLAPGNYAVSTVVLVSSNMFPTSIGVPGSPDPDLNVLGSWGSDYVLGTPGAAGGAGNTSWQTKNVTNGTLHVYVYTTGFVDTANCQGVQLVPLDPAVTRMCAGDGTLAPCPCANTGVGGRGCNNSLQYGGAYVTFSGHATPDTLVLQSIGMLPSSTAIFLQGTANIAPLSFGDGVRCTGGTLKRLYLKTASAGVASAPQTGDLPITQRSAALGDPIPPGDRRYYQVYYRDPNPNFCPAPTGATWNITNSLRVFW